VEDRTKRALEVLDEWGLLAACGLSFILSGLYFWPPPFIAGDAREFLRALVTNVIPVLLLFATSYLVLRKAQALRSEIEREELIEAVSAKTKGVLVDQFNAIALKVESTSQLVRDWDEKGVERVCAESETGAISAKELETTDFLKIIGIGNGWLLKGEQHARLERLLARGASVRVLIPDPLSPQIKERYSKDEPESRQLNLAELAGLVLEWHELAQSNPSLGVRVYNRYPMMNVSVYRGRVLASPILYRRRGKEGLTFVFRRPSIGAEIYEGHFDKVYESGATEISPVYLFDLERTFCIGSSAT
jgi:hypothetical protein